MRYVIDHDYHIHTQLSLCSRHPEQTVENIIKFAKANALTSICITDHYWDSAVAGASSWYSRQGFDHISKVLPLPEDSEVRCLFGCEADMDKNMTIGVSKEMYRTFDFIIIPTTHLHMNTFTVSDDGSEDSETRASLWALRFDALLKSDLPFKKVGVAHLACTLTDPRSYEDYLTTLNLIKSTDMHDLFTVASKKGLGIELNSSDMEQAIKHPDTVLRMFKIAKDAGCKFYLGSDSHTPEGFEGVIDVFNYSIDALGLTEDDKFRIEGL